MPHHGYDGVNRVAIYQQLSGLILISGTPPLHIGRLKDLVQTFVMMSTNEIVVVPKQKLWFPGYGFYPTKNYFPYW